MVTRKTRLLSALMAVLMLTTLFTAITLPAVAAGQDISKAALDAAYPDAPVEWPADLVAYKNRSASDTTKNYAITDAADWLAAVADSNALKSTTRETFKGLTLWFTADIDFAGVSLDQDGDGTVEYEEVMMSTFSTNAFAGTVCGQGFAIKNLVIDVSPVLASSYQALGLICYGSTGAAVIRDLTYASGSITVRATSDSIEAYCGVFLGYGYGSVIANCWNNADLHFYDDGTGKDNSISCFGRKQYCTVVNSFNSGTLVNHDTTGARVTVLSEWRNGNSKDLNLYNSFNYGTLISESTHSTYQSWEPGLVSTNGTAANATTKVNLSNIINVGYPIAAGNNNKATLDAKGTQLETGAEATGELAWMLNANYDTKYDATYGRKYYTLDDGMTVWGTAANQTVKLAVSFMGETYIGYANAGEAYDLTKIVPGSQVQFELADTTDGTVTGQSLTVDAANVADNTDLTVNLTASFTGNAYTGFLEQDAASFGGKDLTKYSSADYPETTLAALLNEIATKVANNGYADQAAVEAEQAKLATYKVTGVVSISEIDKYGLEAGGYTVATKEEMDILAEIFGALTTSQTIYITADIDMKGSAKAPNFRMAALKASIDGGNHTISNLYVTNAWLGDYAGAFIKDLTFKDCIAAPTSTARAFLINAAKSTTEISNVTLDHVIVNHGATPAGIYALMIAQLNGGNLTLKDIEIVNSQFNRGDFVKPADSDSTYCNSGIVLGKTYNGTLTVDGLYLNNNIISGDRTGSGTGVVFGEIICDVTIKNVGIFNTTVDDGTIRGVLSSMIKWGTNSETGDRWVENPVVVIDNVIAANNGETANLVVNDETYSMSLTVNNAYTDTTKVAAEAMDTLSVNNCVAEADEAIASGEAAYELNKVVEEKWIMKANGTPAFGTAGVFKVELSAADVANENTLTQALYTDENGKLLGLDKDLREAAVWNGDLDQTFTADATVTGLMLDEHDHVWDYSYDADKDTHSATCKVMQGDVNCPATLDETACAFDTLTPADSTVAPAEGQVHTHSCDCGNGYTEACVLNAVTSPADCEEDGSVVTTCACGYEHTEVLTKLGHDWAWTHDDATSGDASEHTRKCARCEKDERAACSYGEWVTVPATKEAEGSKTRTCSVCNHADVVVLPKLVYVALDAEPAVKGETVEVQVNLVNNPGISGMTIKLDYDTDIFTLTNVTQGDLIKDAFFASAIKGDGTVTNQISFTNNANINADGTVATLTFAVSEEADPKDYSFTVTATAANEDIEHVTVVENVSTIAVLDYIKGDLNGDRYITIADAVLLLRYYNGLSINYTVNVKAADVYIDPEEPADTVNTKDVVYLLQYLNGWYETL